MRRRPPRTKRTDTHLPYTTLFRSGYDKIWDAEATNAFLPYAQAKESLGNLMLLEAPININAGNDYYDQKKPKYKNSLIYLTKALVELTAVGRDKQPDRFNKHRSEERRVGKECDSTCRSRW